MTEPAVKATRKGLISTTAEFPDYKTGEPVVCISQGEMMLWYILRWDDDIDHIDTQVALDNDRVDSIINEIRGSEIYAENPLEPDNRENLSTDLVAYLRNGLIHAYQVKSSREEVKGDKEQGRLLIEALYWKSLGVKWNLMFKEDINKIYVDNIKDVTRYYDEQKVHDEISKLQHLIAVKKLTVDMTVPIDWPAMLEQYNSLTAGEHHE